MSRIFKFFLRLLFLFLIVGTLLLAYSKYIEPFHVITKNITISSPHVGERADGLRIIIFADTHFGDFYLPKHFEKVVASINLKKPDLVFFLGDLIDHYAEYEGDPNEISRLLNEIRAPQGKVAIFGNHDYGGGAEGVYSNIMKNGGFHVLVNEVLYLAEKGVRITGIDDIVIGRGDPQTAKGEDEDFFHIVLSHAPDLADEVACFSVDLVLSAHTHGRQINLKGFDEKILPAYGTKYIKGSYSLENERKAILYVNAGIGMTQLPLRFLSPPELTVFTLENTD
jgi:predicted MPP superfamily phosphohydrolase